MHDSGVVALEIRRPWPQRSRMHDAKAGGARWAWRLRHKCGPWCTSAPHRRDPFPWWKPSSYGPFMTVAGRGLYWPPVMVIWHEEPGGADSGEVCRHYDRATRQIKTGWKWHVHHWRIQIPPLQEAHRRIFGRCGWCGRRSTRRWPVNVSHQWDRTRPPLFHIDRGLFHMQCSTFEEARRRCTCAKPPLIDRFHCVRCGLHLDRRRHPAQTAAYVLLKTVPYGTFDQAIYDQAVQLFAQARADERVG